MMEKCSQASCEESLNDESSHAFLFLVKNIFGPFGDRLVRGYCQNCAQRNVARAWMVLIILISTVVAIVELPWKGPLFAIGVIGVWTGICWSWLFPRR